MKLDRKMVAVAVAAFALAFFVARNESDSIIPNPFAPQKPDRPFLKFVVKAAKTFLWVAMFAEPKPPVAAHHVVLSRIGPDGHECLNHAEGF